MPETTDASQTTETAKKPATRSAQDTRIANNIADARTLVSQTQADSALVAKLTIRGFTEARLTALIALVGAALTSAASAPYKAALAAVGFTDAKHAALTVSLATHETRRMASDTAKRDALTATAARDSTYKALGTGLLPLKRTLKLIEKSG